MTDFDAAVAEFRRALHRRVDSHVAANPRAGVPRVACTAAPRFSTRLWPLAVAAALVIVAVGGAIVWPRGARVYAAGADGLQITLADGSRVEMRAHSELTVDRATDGIWIDLKKGDIIVTAAEQGDERLYVQTEDITVAVVGTVFLVNIRENGSRVAVIEGEVRVREGETETTLKAGEHVATGPSMDARPVLEEIAWSRKADAHLALLLQSVPQNPAQAATAAQVTPRPRFEEASIRPCTPDSSTSAGGRGGGGGENAFTLTPGRLYAYCITLSTLIRTAYEYDAADDALARLTRTSDAPAVRRGFNFGDTYYLGGGNSRRVRGGPDWIRSDLYTIEAVADSSASALTMQQAMLQELLERRFQLRVHVEAEQVPAVALLVAPGGLKLKPVEPGSCSTERSTEAIRAERQRRGWRGGIGITEAAFLGVKPTCGWMYGDQNGPNIRTEYVFQPLANLGIPIAGALGVPVRDRTGIADQFTFVLEFGPDESTPNARLRAPEPDDNPRPGFDGPPTLPKAPPLRTVLEQELGLRVEPIRVPNEFIVVDAVERLSPN